MRRISIGLKLLIIYMVVAVPMVAVIVLGYLDRYQSRSELVLAERTDTALLTAQSFTLLITEIGVTMEAYGTTILDNRYSADKAASTLRKLVQLYPVDQAFLTDPTGKVTAATDSSLIGTDFSGDEPFKAVISGSTELSVEPAERTQRPVGFHIARALRAQDGTLRGLVVSFLDIGRLQTALPAEVTMGGTNIVDSSGNLVYQSEFPNLPLTKPYWGNYGFVKTALAGRHATSTDFVDPGDGVVDFVAEVPIREFGWAAGSGVDRDEIMAPVRRGLLESGLTTGVVLLFALIIGALIARRIVRSLTTLATAAKEMGRGQFDAPIAIQTGDEIEDVAGSLDRARQDLKSSTEELRTSQRQVLDILNSISDAFISLDNDWRFTYVNRQAERFLEKRKEQLLYRTVWTAFPDVVSTAFKKEFEDAKKTGLPTVFEEFYPPLNRWFRVNAYPYPGGLSVYFADITERKRSEAQLQELMEVQQESERRFRGILESTQLIAVVLDTNGKITFANDFLLRVLGWQRDELIGQNWFDTVAAPEDRDEVRKTFERAYATGVITPYGEYHVITRQGQKRFVSFNRVVLRDTRGAVVGTASIGEDITERKERERLGGALNEINAAINSTLDFDEIMQRVVVQSAEILGAEAAGIAMLEDDRWVARYLYGFSTDQAGKELAPDEVKYIDMIIHAAKPVAVSDALYDQRVDGEMMRRHGVRSLLAVPLLVRGEPMGVMRFVFLSAPVAFTRAHIDFVERLAAAISLAIENARLFESQRRIADTLQSSLLTVPENIQGVKFGHLYRSATETAKVGGDFYDLFELEHDKVGIILGDVSGKGLEAAALTSVVKNTIHAYAFEEYSAADVMAKTNDVVRAVIDPSSFITVFFAILDIPSGKLTYCSAGHPSAIIKRATEGVTVLETHSPIIGAFKDLLYVDEVATLLPGDILFIYTDGLIEARRGAEMFSEGRLVDVLKPMGATSAKDLPQVIFDEVMRFTGGKLADDLALFAMSLAGDNPH